MPKLTPAHRQATETALSAHPDIIAAWLFGSAQSGELRPGSDLDIAVLFETSPTLDRLVELRADLQQATQIDAIDLVVLNNASPVLRFEAISGQDIYCRDMGQRATFVSLSAREYEDEMAQLQRALSLG
jgi:predicted nucleotidyltransferase